MRAPKFDDKGKFKLIGYDGNIYHLTRESWEHVIKDRQRDTVKFNFDKIELTITHPDEVRKSRIKTTSKILYRKFDRINIRKKYHSSLERILCRSYRYKEETYSDYLSNPKDKTGVRDMRPIDVKFDYDEDGDVLYISFGTGEPSYCDEVDGMLLVERGIITNAIIGFRILDVRHHRIKSVQIWVGKMERILEKEKKETPMSNVYVDALRQDSVRTKLEELICA